MDALVIKGGVPLTGKVNISGAKNSALKLMCASILTEEPLTLTNVPNLADVTTLSMLLAQMGVKLSSDGDNRLKLQADKVTSLTAPYELVKRMRASIIVLGPLLTRFGEAKISLPGGCTIGTRPIDLHLKALEKMGAKIDFEDGYLIAKAARLKGAEIYFEKVSVGATENTLMAATLAEGTTTLINAAQEPEITDLAECLVKMGAKIEGIGTNRLTIHGVEKLSGTTHEVVADRIETGSFIIASAITGGELELVNARAEHLGAVLQKLEETGIKVEKTKNGLLVKKPETPIKTADVVTEPYPGFPTDMQAQFMTLMTIATGASTIDETIFENRYMHVPELGRMGAKIKVSGNHATVTGVPKLKAAEVMATDLRASFSLVIAALAAEGETKISRVYHIDRGYDRVEDKLRKVGANIVRIKEAK